MKENQYRFITAFYLAVILSFCLLQSACSDKAPDIATPSAEEINAKALETAQLKLKAETEEKGRMSVEKQLKETSDSEKHYEKITWILGLFAVFAFLAGIAIGSLSRKEADSLNNKIDR